MASSPREESSKGPEERASKAAPPVSRIRQKENLSHEEDRATIDPVMLHSLKEALANVGARCSGSDGVS